MESQELHTRFHQFCNLVHLFLDINLILVNRKLIPEDYLDQTLTPEGISRSYEAMLFGGILFQCPHRTVCQITTPFAICFCAMELKDKDGFAVLGPYLPDIVRENETLDRILVENGISLVHKEEYQAYLEQLPVINKAKLMAIMGGLASHLYGEELDPTVLLHEVSMAKADPAPCPVFEEDALQAQADALQTRYDKEQAFMDAIARGDESALDTVGWIALNRLPNRLRNQKNLMIVLNTLLRKSVERAKVHPYYIDAISGKWAVLIENAGSVAQLDDYYYAIVRDYCALVRKHALKNYTPNIRAAINCIHFNLDNPKLSLAFLAETVGINATYLSHQFNREVGSSVPNYIAGMRIQRAKELLAR
ncbi:AraC family transcriptional regulator [Flavonifractor sp. An100]|uniref:helix-turn-helix domain-containing protein n=1 Tax=Flavonifractor sp. An100 TaxID=1965538 RepID=UPI000B39D82E|nr:AraC family transcriptional regulator [Flavonifractor sp. An100]OUQ75228.1 hypothetical protein B5E43_14010 [Flavonifractor sp. An100]